MASPVNFGSAQQAAIANPFQQQNNRVTEDQRRQEETRTKETRAQETEKTEKSENRQQNNVQTAGSSKSEAENNTGRDRERGSLVDLSV